MLVDGAAERPVRFLPFVHVIEASFIVGEDKAAKISARETVREHQPSRHIQNFKDSGALPSLFDFIQQESPCRRNSEWSDGSVPSSSVCGWIDEQLVFAGWPLAHENACLLLFGQTFPKEIPAAGLPEGIAGLDREEFPDPRSNESASRHVIEVRPCVAGLLANPFPRSRRILVLEPAVGIGD